VPRGASLQKCGHGRARTGVWGMAQVAKILARVRSKSKVIIQVACGPPLGQACERSKTTQRSRGQFVTERLAASASRPNHPIDPPNLYIFLSIY